MTSPPPPSSGDEREDQAAIAGAEVAAILAAAAAAILAAMAAAIISVASGSLGWQMARRRIRTVISATLGAASARIRPVLAKAAQEASAGGHAAGGGHGGPGVPVKLPGWHKGGSSRTSVLPDAPHQIAAAILSAQRDAGEAFDAAMAAALGGKGSPLPPKGSPYYDAVEKAMRRLTGLGGDVKDLTGAERVAQSLSRLQAAQHVMTELAGKGLTGFTDSAGRRWSLDAYAEMATRTAASRMHLSSQLSAMAQAGNDLVIVDNPSKAAPCPLCRPFEGTVLSLSGPGTGSSTITDAGGTQRTEKINGTLTDAVAHGLLHPNCRHSLSPWMDGAGAVATAGGMERGYEEHGQPISEALPIGSPRDYANEQKLRAHERAVRRDHVRLSAALTPQARARARSHLAVSQGALQDHVTATGALRQPRREKPFKIPAQARRRPPSGGAPPRPASPRGPQPPRPQRPPAAEPVISRGPLAGFKARKLSGNQEAASYLESVKPNLSAGQDSALSYYTGDGFQKINAALRQGDETRDPETIRLLDSAMKPTQDDLIATRRVDASAFGLTDSDLGKLAGLKGKTITDPAYMSTSLGSPYGGGLGGVTMHLAVPKGTPALPASAFSRNPHETELLLGRGTQIAISRVEKNPKTLAWEVWGVIMPGGKS
jgi:hypothetical protein